VQFVNANFDARAEQQDAFTAPENTKINLAKDVTLQPRQTIELDIPAADGNSGVTLMAQAAVSATLINDKGAIVGKSAANSPEASADFRTISIDKSATVSNLKLKLENTSAAETGVIVAAWTNTDQNQLSFTVETGKANAGQFPITAKLFLNDSPVANAVMKARIKSDDGKAIEVVLRDDGKSGDGVAIDGVYAALTERLTNGEYAIEAVAEMNGQMRLAATSLSVGATTPTAPTKTAIVKAVKK
jgi:hypothetical protein